MIDWGMSHAKNAKPLPEMDWSLVLIKTNSMLNDRLNTCCKQLQGLVDPSGPKSEIQKM